MKAIFIDGGIMDLSTVWGLARQGHGFRFGALMGIELARTIAEGRDSTAHARWAAGLVGDGPT